MEIKIRDYVKANGRKKPCKILTATFENGIYGILRSQTGQEEHADEYIDR